MIIINNSIIECSDRILQTSFWVTQLGYYVRTNFKIFLGSQNVRSLVQYVRAHVFNVLAAIGDVFLELEKLKKPDLKTLSNG